MPGCYARSHPAFMKLATGILLSMSHSDSSAPADAFVVFGITGDLARKMTLRSLYRLERRGLLDCPVVGVASSDWTVERLIEHARQALEDVGEPIDEAVFKRFAGRLRYISGDFTDAATYERLARELGDAARPVYYLEVPPSLFAGVVAGLAGGGRLPAGARVVVEKPFGHDLASAHELATALHEHLDESQLYRVDHFLGKMGLDELLYLRFANTILEPVWSREWVSSVEITLAERFGVRDRGHFYDPVGALRDVVVNHMLQLVAATAMEAPASADADSLKDTKFAVFQAMRAADPAHYVRGQYTGYADTEGVAKGSTTETYAALRIEIDNWRWAGVPFFLRTGKRLPVTATEVRLVFKDPPRLSFIPSGHRPPVPDQLVVRFDPATGIRLTLDAKRADAPGPQEIDLDMEFAEEGGEAPTPYEVLLGAAIAGDSSHFVRMDSVEETWRVVQPLLDAPGPAHPYAQGSWGPEAAEDLVAEFGGWHGPWTAPKPD
jgi:glucose-6-phosphate 1-dehydrogenase